MFCLFYLNLIIFNCNVSWEVLFCNIFSYFCVKEWICVYVNYEVFLHTENERHLVL